MLMEAGSPQDPLGFSYGTLWLQFTLTGSWFPQDLLGAGAAEGGEEKWKEKWKKEKVPLHG